MISYDIATYLNERVDVPVFVGAIPESGLSSELAAGVRDVPGGISEYVMGPSVPSRVSYTVGLVQVSVRGPKDGWEEVWEAMKEIHALLRFAAGVTVNGHTYDKIMAEVEPYMVSAPDTMERPMYAVTYECWQLGA